MNKKIIVSAISIISLIASVAGAQIENPVQDQDIVQFNNLTIISVSPSEIVVGFPFMLNGGTGSGENKGGDMPSPQCLKFQGRDTTEGKSVACPTPVPLPTPTAPSVSSSQSNPAIVPNPPQTRGYRIEISSATKLYLRDRSVASISDFSAGDQINVFGFYNADGSIQGILVRNLSKPVERNFMQLNNVEVVSVSSMTPPADVVVAQRQNYPCYDYGASGEKARPFPCPMGVQSLQNRSETKGLTVPQSLMPIWNGLLKYVVKVDAQTVIMSRTKGQLSLSDLKIGDKLNIYGSSADNGATIDADIIRDVSNPPMATTLSGTITSVNTDGSFVIQTSDGRSITVSNPVTVGARVQVTGMFDAVKNLLTQITKFVLGGEEKSPPPMPMMKSQGMINGSGGMNSSGTQR